MLPKGEPRDESGENSLQIQEQGRGRGGRNPQPPHEQEWTDHPAAHNRTGQPRGVSAGQRGFTHASIPTPAAKKPTHPQTDSRAQVQQPRQQNWLNPWRDCLREWSAEPEQSCGKERAANSGLSIRGSCHGKTLAERSMNFEPHAAGSVSAHRVVAFDDGRTDGRQRLKGVK